MSTGTRYYNWREGDRSEYLAVYLLSALGLVTQVPRQEDVGFDLVCNLAEQESGILSFRHHYLVSLKSASTPRAVLDPPESKEKDPNYSEHFNWLFHLELPLMLGVVDKKKQELSLYSTLPAWFIYHERLNECGIIELVPHLGGSEEDQVGVDRPTDCGIEAKAGGRRRFEVNLGFPIMVLNVNELKDKELLRRKKHSLRRAIDLGAQSARFARMGTPFFWWFNVTIPTGFVYEKTNPDGYNGGVAWIVGPCRNDQLGQMMAGLAPGLMSAALLFKQANQPGLLKSLRDAMRLLPGGSVPPEVQNALPEIYS